MDKISVEARSWTMSRVKSKDTTPEQIVRATLHRLGYRFRLHRKDLPGNPDIVLPKRRAVIFVHGCFWHRHPNCKRASTPTSHVSYWQAKFQRTVRRDEVNQASLRNLGWRVLIVWECELKDLDALTVRLTDFLIDSSEMTQSDVAPPR